VRKIYGNFLYLDKTSDFTDTTLKNFFERLLLFLNPYVSIDTPSVIFTHKEDTLEDYYGEEVSDYPLAWYDEDTNNVLFNANKYDYKSKLFRYSKTKFPEIHEDLIEYNDNFRYVIPFSDIYHELVHVVQYHCIDQLYMNPYYTDFIEGSDEIMTYLTTGHHNIQYLDESIALWYIGRKFLRLNLRQFYIFILDANTNRNFSEKYLLSNKNFINLLSKKYDGRIELFFKNIITFSDRDYEAEFNKDIKKIYNLIFYKF